MAVTVIDQIPQHESLFLNMSLNDLAFQICAVYRPPEAARSFLTQLYDYLLPHCNRNIIHTGDFNWPSINWQRLLYEQSEPNNATLNILLALNLLQLVHEPTRQNNILDLFFVSQKFSHGELNVETVLSDHHLLFFCWNFNHVVYRDPCSVSTVKDFDRADDVSIIDYLEIDFDKAVNDNVVCLWKRFGTAVKYCVTNFIPSKRLHRIVIILGSIVKFYI